MKTLNIPLDLACRHDVNYTSKIVYGFLRSYYEEFNSFPTIQEIAKSLDRSRQLISKAIANLRDTKIIRTVRTGLANIYIFLTEDVNSSMTSKQNDIIEEINDVNSSDISSKQDDIVEETEDVNSNDISEKHNLLEPYGQIAFMDGFRDLEVSVLNNALFKFGPKYVGWALRYAKHKNNKYRALEKCFKKMHKKYSQTIKN